MDDAIPWGDFQPATMAWFLERLTLHDSGLEKVSMDALGSTEVRVGLDLHWNSTIPDEHSVLSIHFDQTYRVIRSTGGWIQSTLYGVSSTALDEQQRADIRAQGQFDRDAYHHSGTDNGFTYPPEDPTLTRTTFECVNWGSLELLHAAPVRFAIATQDTGPFVDLTTLALTPRAKE